MSLKHLSCLLFIPFILSSFGCRTVSSHVTSANVTMPVILGPVKKIGEQTVSALELPPVVGTFEAETEETFGVSSDGDGNSSMEQRKEGSNKIDAEIMKVAAQGDVVRAEGVYFGSYTIFLLTAISMKAFAGIEGTVHTGIAQNDQPAN